MTLPADWATVRVTAHYLLRDGSVPTGTVTFSSPQVLRADGAIVMPVDIVATLDGTGAIDIQLPATNDPDVSPAGWAYTVQERIDGCAGRRFAMAVDADGGDIDLATVAPVVPPAVMGALSAYNLTIGTITTLAAGSAATAAIRGALPNQVLDLGLPRGASGDGTGASAFVFQQASVADTWTINHNLGYYPQVTLFDIGNSVFHADIDHPSANQTIVRMASGLAVAGSARLQ